jgi:two-component system CheB/CheR fusion protein
LDYAELAQDIQQVFGSRAPLERRVSRRHGGAHYIVRVLPYWTGSGKVEGAVLTFSDVTSLAEAEEQQRVVLGELNHHVKSMLTCIESIATHSLRSDDAAREAFLGRLHAMVRAYELVSRDQRGDVSLREVVGQEIERYRAAPADRLVIQGPDVALKPNVALSLGMIIHELGTNSAQYGSLSSPEGSLEISWATERRSRNSLVLHWIERGGPAASKPRRNAFGLRLVEREVSEALGGKAKIEFEPDGLRANFRIPLDSP